VLSAVEDEGTYANIAIRRVFHNALINDADKRLATEIAMGTLRRQMLLDWWIDSLLTRPLQFAQVRRMLRMAAYQIAFLDRVPDSAAVDEAVKLARWHGFDALTGFVNGVLRKLAASWRDIALPDPLRDPVKRLSVESSTPEWIVRLWVGAYGQETAEALCGQDYRGGISMMANPLKMSTDALDARLAAKGIEATPGRVWPDCRVLSRVGDIAADEDFEEGRTLVIGEASAWAASLIGAKPGMRILDACAAPGGKSMVMAMQAGNQAHIDAWDLHTHRVGLLQASVHRMGLDCIHPAVRDAKDPSPAGEEGYDAVILDAPCSGLGTLSHRPELALRMQRKDITNLASVQLQLLQANAKRVKQGGVLVYATCTLTHEENRDVVAAFLRAWPEFRPELPADMLPQGVDPARVEQGTLTLLPHIDGCDGFFVARMIRRV